MVRTAFVFPGQGSQSVGMGKDLYGRFHEAREVYDQADRILGFPLSEMCFEGPEEDLRLTSNTQPALLATSVACLRVLEKNGVRPDAVAGHSVGEYAALVAAGTLEFDAALPLVRRRGELMQEAGASRPGTMAAIIGLDAEQVRRVCDRASDAGVLEVANYNSPGQVVVSGGLEAIEAASRYAQEAGARRVIQLNVSGAFHSRLMTAAAETLATDLAGTRFRDALVPVAANVTGDYVSKADDIRDALARQITGSVRWEESVLRMARDGVLRFVEVGPGKVLSGLIKRTVDSAEVRSVGDVATLEEFLRNPANQEQ